MRPWLIVGAFFCALAVVRTQAPTFRGAVDLVQLDVAVLDQNRQPVKGLTADDFTVLQSGAAQPIMAFSAVDLLDRLDTSATWMREVSLDVSTNRPPGRIVVILFDDTHVPADPSALMMGRKIANTVVDALGPDDVAAVTFTDAANTSRRQEITNDRAKLRAAIDSFVPHASPPVLLGGGRRSGAGANPICQYAGPYHSVFSCLISAFVNVGEALRSAPQGRKTLIYISAGPELFPPGTAISNLTGADAPFGEVISEVQAVLRAMHEANISIYSIDPTGLTAQGIMGPRFDSLRMFAEETGGRATLATNTPWDAVPQTFRENSSYYMLGIRPSKMDGQFHGVRVTVNRPGVEVRARSGYYAPVAIDVKRRLKDVPGSADDLDTLIAQPLADGTLPLRGSAVPIALSPSSEPIIAITIGLPADTATSVRQVDLAAMAIYERCADCRTRPTQRETIEFDDASAGSREVLSRLTVKPGHYSVRVAVRAENRAGSVFADVDVPDFRKTQLSASGLIFSVNQPTTTLPRNLVADVMPVVPTTLRDFTRNQTASTFVRIYQGGSKSPAPVSVQAAIVNSADVSVFDQTVVMEPTAFSRTRSADYQMTLPSASLDAGAYLLTITASSGSEKVIRTARFTVR
jgi:VWFA-related protein